ncbi:hypothetical protein [Nocardioides marinquilinus]|uniref:hypothetical protein n=1 Tax=Nocardioides marinquilinus TaxID=1210400 RepID=UPI0031E66A48
MRALTTTSALVGGVLLVVHLFVVADWLSWTGLGLVGLAVALAASRLGRAPWLSLVCAAGALGLAWAVLETGRELGPDREVEAVVGGLATLAVAVAVMRTPVRRPGNHRS